MSRTMYDSVDPLSIPTNADLIAGYIDGRYAWPEQSWLPVSGVTKVQIAVRPTTNDGHVLDVETGDALPTDAPGWVVKRRAAGAIPSVYCNVTTWPAVRQAFSGARVPEPGYWIAAYPGIGPIIYPGAVAHQYADPGPYDLSIVADYWPGVDPVPANGGTMALIDNPVDACVCPTGGMWVLGADGGVGNYDGAPFHGSYPGLPANERQGTRTFLAIEATATGYVLLANDGTEYQFPVVV